jgi:hypothetical protein
MKTLLFLVAATGFVVSLLVHVTSFSEIPVLKLFPRAFSVFMLYAGMFVITLIGTFSLEDFSTLLSKIRREFVAPMNLLWTYAAVSLLFSVGTAAGPPNLSTVFHENALPRWFSAQWLVFYYFFAATFWPERLKIARASVPLRDA